MTTWVDAWPIVLAAALTAPSFWRWGAFGSALYFAPFMLGTIGMIVFAPLPASSLEAEISAIREAITPVFMLVAWFVFAGIPTAALLLFLNRRTRAVSPFLLAFTTIVSSGCIVAWLAIYTDTGKALFVRTAVAANIHVGWLLLGALVLAILSFGIAGWLVLTWVRKAYLRKTISDRSLSLDALWLFFASYHATQFALQGVLWAAVGALAYAAYKLMLAAATARSLRRSEAIAPRGLTFLRVFSLGTRSNELFDALGKHWRRIGSMQLITGPDVAHSTVQPHQLLDFLAERLASHFIGDARSLDARMRQLDRAPDRDGWFRVNNFFCHADAWQAALARLVGEGDVILMDLRSFSSRNGGCVHELRHLVNHVPLGRCVLVVDASTDRAYLDDVLQDEWRHLAADSPNRSALPEAVLLHRLDSGGPALRRLLKHLCAAA